jgi:hypothetical protein
MLGGKQHLKSHELFERYGDVVRTGPDHLIIRDAAAIPVLLGGKNMWHKGARESHRSLKERTGMAEHVQGTTLPNPTTRRARCSRK